MRSKLRFYVSIQVMTTGILVEIYFDEYRRYFWKFSWVPLL